MIEPFPPKDLKAVPDFKGIYLTWSLPEYPTLDKIRHFIVEVNAGNKDIINVTSEKTSFRISDVFPSTSYYICMSTCVRTGTQIESDQRQIKTESRYTELIHCETPGKVQINTVLFTNDMNRTDRIIYKLTDKRSWYCCL